MGKAVNSDRPINLDLTKFKFPPMAIVSITHRISGVLMFLFVPLAIYLLHEAVASEQTFAALQQALQGVGMRLAVWIGLSATFYHVISGTRHLIMDFGFWETVRAGRMSAYGVFVLGIVVAVLVGVWVW